MRHYKVIYINFTVPHTVPIDRLYNKYISITFQWQLLVACACKGCNYRDYRDLFTSYHCVLHRTIQPIACKGYNKLLYLLTYLSFGHFSLHFVQPVNHFNASCSELLLFEGSNT